MCRSCYPWLTRSRHHKLYVLEQTFKQTYWLTGVSQTREKKQSKIEQSGMTNEELIRAQEELFKSAGEKYNAVSPTDG